MHTRRGIITGLSTVPVIYISGCVDFLDDDPPVEALETNIVDVYDPDVGLTSATIPILFEIKNTHSSDDIPTPTLDYNVLVNGVQIASARETIASLGAGDTTQEEFEFTAEYTDLGDSIVSAIQDQSFQIRIEGEIESEDVKTTFESQYDA